MLATQFYLELSKGFKMEIVSEQRLVSALSTTARLIEAYGDSYWPIFDRLEKEVNLVRERKAKLEKYNSIVLKPLESSSIKLNLENQND